MLQLRITKYDPAKRDERGRYPLDEWTAFSDIGESFGGVVLTEAEYQLAEDQYVLALRQLLVSAGLDELTIRDLESANTRKGALPNNLGVPIADGQMLCGSEIEIVVRMVLREMLWCRLSGAGNTYVHFGWDYYMYFGTERELHTLPSPPHGIYFERFPSPY